MTKSKKDVKFNHRERRNSSDLSYDSPTESRSPTRMNGAKSGARSASGKDERPAVDRTDTTASGWQTENEDEKVSDNDVIWQ